MNKLLYLPAAIFSLVPFAPAHAAPLRLQEVPGDAKWVAHLDVDHLRNSVPWKLIDERLQNNPDVQEKINQIAAFSGMRVPQDLHDVTIFGKVTGDDAGTVVVHAMINREQTLTFLQMNDTFTSKSVGTHEVVTWTDKGKNNYGAFFNESTFIIAHSDEQVTSELDTLDDATKAVKADDTLVAGVNDHQLLYLGTNDLSILRKAANLPFMKKIDSGWVAVDDGENSVLATARLHSVDAASAQQVNTSLAGLVAMVGLMSGGKPDDANLSLLNEAVQSAGCSVEGQAVSIRWPIPETVLSKAADRIKPVPEAAK